MQVILCLHFEELWCRELLSYQYWPQSPLPCGLPYLTALFTTVTLSITIFAVNPKPLLGALAYPSLLLYPNSYHYPGCSEPFACHWAHFQGMILCSVCNSFQNYIQGVYTEFSHLTKNSLLISWYIVCCFFLKIQIIKYLK